METNIAPLYRIWGTDLLPYGPIELPTLVTWIKDERVTADSWVFVDEKSTWQRASTLPELKMFFDSKKPPSAVKETPIGLEAYLKPSSLRRIKVFAEMEERHIQSFLKYMEVVRLKQFSEVVRRGEHGDAMYLVLEGEVRARIMVTGKESTLSTLGVGAFFGEISLLDHGPRSTDIVANADSVLLKISTASFEKLIRESPALALPFLYALSRSVVGRVRDLTKRYEDSIHFSRVAAPDP